MKASRRIQVGVGFVLALGVLGTLTGEVAAAHTTLLGDPMAPWTSHVGDVDAALARGDVKAADRALDSAYRAALGSRRWEGMVAVGDAALRIGHTGGALTPARERARRVYLLAFERAKYRGSVDGVLTVARSFESLGDVQVVEVCVRTAKGLAKDARTQQQVSEFVARRDARVAAAE